MEETIKETVSQAESNSVHSETENHVQEQSSDNRYKKDMFKYKQEARELKERLDAIDQEKQVKKGNYESVINELKDRLAAEKKEKAQLTNTVAETALDNAIKTTALSKGIKGQKLDVFMKLISDEQKGIVEFDDRFNVRGEDVDNVVDDTLKRYGDIFNTRVNVTDQTPNNNPVHRPTKKLDLAKASSSEIVEYMLKNKDRLK